MLRRPPKRPLPPQKSRKGWLFALVPLAIWLVWGSPGKALSPESVARDVAAAEGDPARLTPDGPGGLAALKKRLKMPDLSNLRLPTSAGGDTVVRVLVIDSRGKPAPGATVDGSALTGDLLEPPLPVVTDLLGEASFRIALPMGGRATGVLSAVSGELRASSEPFEASFPDTRKFPIQIQLAEQSFVRGTVLLDGQPVAGATLVARQTSYARSPVARAVSGHDGRYELVLPAPATYRLAADYLGISGDVPDLELTAGQRERTVDVSLTGQDLTALVTDPDGRPLAGVEIKNRESEVTLAVTDELGHASVRGGLIEGRVNLHFGREGYEAINAVRILEDKPASEPMHITMRPALALAGVMHAPPDALIELWAQPVSESGGDQDRFTVATLHQPGPFRADVRAEDGQYVLGGYVEGVGEIPTRTIMLERGNVVDVGTLEASAARGVVTGLVEDETGHPLAGAEVKAKAHAGRAMVAVTTDGQGRFSFDLPAGGYDVIAFQGPRYIGQQGVDVGAEPATVQFMMPECTRWSLPSFDRVTEDGIVVVESLTSGLQPGDRIMELDGNPASEESETLESGNPMTANVISSSGYAYETKITPICIR